MFRRTALVSIALLLVAAPAIAKGPDGVVLSAGDQEVAVEWQHVYGADGDLASLVHVTHLYDVDWIQGSSHGGAWEEGSSTAGLRGGDLGPVVVATWNFPDPVESVIVQHLYPFAEGGPVGHVLDGQEYFDTTIVGAWHPLRPDVVEVLSAAGLDLTRLEQTNDAGVVVGGTVLALCAIIAGRRWRDGSIRG
jgi:hypothetical protein